MGTTNICFARVLHLIHRKFNLDHRENPDLTIMKHNSDEFENHTIDEKHKSPRISVAHMKIMVICNVLVSVPDKVGCTEGEASSEDHVGECIAVNLPFLDFGLFMKIASQAQFTIFHIMPLKNLATPQDPSCILNSLSQTIGVPAREHMSILISWIKFLHLATISS